MGTLPIRSKCCSLLLFFFILLTSGLAWAQEKNKVLTPHKSSEKIISSSTTSRFSQLPAEAREKIEIPSDISASLSLWNSYEESKRVQAAEALESEYQTPAMPPSMMLGGGPTTPLCPLDKRANSGQTIFFKPFHYCGAEALFPRAVNNSGLIVGTGSFSGYMRGYSIQSTSNGDVSNFRALNKGPYQMTFALTVSDGGVIGGAACLPGDCDTCTNPATGQMGEPSDTCQMKAIYWPSKTSNPVTLSILNPPAGVFYHTEVSRISADGSKMSGSVITRYTIPSPYIDWQFNLWGRQGSSYTPLSQIDSLDLDTLHGEVTGDCSSPFAPCLGPWMTGLSNNGKWGVINYGKYVVPEGGAGGIIYRSANVRISSSGILHSSKISTPLGNPTLFAATTCGEDYIPGSIAHNISGEGVYVVGESLIGTPPPCSGTPPPGTQNPVITLFPDPPLYRTGVGSTGYPYKMKAFHRSIYQTSSVDLGSYPSGDYSGTADYFIDYRAYDSASCGSRIVGTGYANQECPAGLPPGHAQCVPNSQKYRRAFIKPSLAGGTQIKNLKTDLLARGVQVDGPGTPTNKYQLTEARAVTDNGNIIVGTAICHGRTSDPIYYGYVVRKTN